MMYEAVASNHSRTCAVAGRPGGGSGSTACIEGQTSSCRASSVADGAVRKIMVTPS